MISIVIPIYNGIEFIDESVQSVLNQTYTDWELIIGINGHPENSDVYKKAKEYEKNDKIKVIDFYKLKGKSITLNEMIKYCTHNYVAILDVDDIWHYNKLMIQTKFLDIYDVIGSRCIYFGERLNGLVPNIPVKDITDFNFLESNPVINSSAIIRKELCFWVENGIEDYDLWLKLKSKNKKFYNCEQITVKHRIHNNSAFNSKGNNNLVTNLLKKYTNNAK
jgi:glycosyltransferase involved in cell wall biosynthesis